MPHKDLMSELRHARLRASNLVTSDLRKAAVYVRTVTWLRKSLICLAHNRVAARCRCAENKQMQLAAALNYDGKHLLVHLMLCYWPLANASVQRSI
jgi:hypothetical protein